MCPEIMSILHFDGLPGVDGHLLSPCSYMGALQLMQDSGLQGTTTIFGTEGGWR